PVLLRYLPSFPTRRSSDLASAPGYREFMSSSFAVHGFPSRPAHGSSDPWYSAATMRPREDSAAPRGPISEVLPRIWTVVAPRRGDRKSTRLNSSHVKISYA